MVTPGGWSEEATPLDQVLGREERSARGRRLRRVAIWVGGTLFLFAGLLTGLWGYAIWANRIAPGGFPAQALPVPNGYERAGAAAARIHLDFPLRERDTLPIAELRAAVAGSKPHLDAVRATFGLSWQATPVEGGGLLGRPLSRFRACSRMFQAEAALARREGRPAEALQRSLDTMELASQFPRGGPLIDGMTGESCHAMGYAEAPRVLPELPPGAASAAIERVRRIRSGWPPFADALETERRVLRADWRRIVELFPHRTPLHSGRYLYELCVRSREGTQRPLSYDLQLWLCRKETAVAAAERYLGQLAEEARKPASARQVVKSPEGPVASLTGVNDYWWIELRRLGTETELALLEAGLLASAACGPRSAFSASLPGPPQDAWGRRVVYSLEGGRPLIYSLGPDGRDDGGRPVARENLQALAPGDIVLPAWAGRERIRGSD